MQSLDVSHPDTSELKFFCASCGKGFMYKYSLAVHTAKSECSKVPKSKVGIPVKVKLVKEWVTKSQPSFPQNLAYIPQIRQNHSTYSPIARKSNLKKVISTEVPGIKTISKIVSTSFSKLKMRR